MRVAYHQPMALAIQQGIENGYRYSVRVSIVTYLSSLIPVFVSYPTGVLSL